MTRADDNLGANQSPDIKSQELTEDARLQAILQSPSYRRADVDLDWIGSPEMRGARLLLEYAKPQIKLVRENVRSTIVLFGSTRIVEPAEAQRRLQSAQLAASAAPADEELARRVRVAERIVDKSLYYEVAREFSQMVSKAFQSDDERHLVVVTGGGPGIMEAGNRGAYEVGAKSIGFNITLPGEQAPNSYVTPEFCFQFRYFALRKMHFLAAAKALIAFPGGYGTLDELMGTLCLIQTQVVRPVPVVLVGEAFWKRALDADFLCEEGMIDPAHVNLFIYAETAVEIRDKIIAWYTERGADPLTGPPPYLSE